MAARRGKKTVDLVEQLAKAPPVPIYAIDGEARILVKEAVDALKTHAVPPHAADFNFQRMSGKKVTAQQVVDAAQMLPAFAERRMVLVDQADALSFTDGFLAYLERPCPTTVLVLVADKKFDARTKAYKTMKAQGAVIRYDAPRPQDMQRLVARRAERMNVRIDDTAVRALVAAVGTDLSAAQQALEVLELYVGPNANRPIHADDVAHVVATTREENIFAFVDAVGAGERAAVLAGLHAMVTVSREPPLRILAMIARHYRHLLKARAALDAGMPREELAGLLGLPGFVVTNVVRQARGHSRASLVRGLKAITAADRSLKGGALSPVRAMERLALQLMGSDA